MAREKYRFRMYERLAKAARDILDQAQSAAIEVAPPDGPGRPEPPRRSDDDAGDVPDLIDRIRELVKETYGDSYDACPTVSTATALALCRAVAIPDVTQPDRNGNVAGSLAVVVPRQKPSELLVGFRPLPPKYGLVPGFSAHGDAKNGPGTPAAVLVPLSGASYSYHGIVPGPVAMLANAQAGPSLQAIAAAAEACYPHLAGIMALGTAVPGCGFTEANDDGLPELHAGLGEIAAEFDVPFLVDNAPGTPFLGPDLSKAMVSAAVFGPFGPGGPGLLIGVEELVVPMLELAGVGGPKAAGRISAAGTSPPVLPSKNTLRDTVDLMTEARRNPERFGRVVDTIYDTAVAGFAQLDDGFKRALRFKKNFATLSVEINYEDTWNEGMGFPVFSAQDALAGTHLVREGLKRMNVTKISAADAAIVIRVPRQTLSEALYFSLDTAELTREIQALVTLLKIIGEKAGYPV